MTTLSLNKNEEEKIDEKIEVKIIIHPEPTLSIARELIIHLKTAQSKIQGHDPQTHSTLTPVEFYVLSDSMLLLRSSIILVFSPKQLGLLTST